MSASRTTDGLARLRAVIQARQRTEIADDAARRAAVLVPLVGGDGGLRVLFFQRSADVWEHKSEVCFPGGSVETHDIDPVAAALREAEEELGIPPGDVEIVGLLDDVLTHVSGYVITPVVGYLRQLPQLRPDPLEVDRPIIVPLEYLLQPGVEQREELELDGIRRPRYSYPFDGLRIWGATGRIVHGLLGLVRIAQPQRAP